MVLRIGEQKWHLHFHTTEAESDESRLARKLPPLRYDIVVKCQVHTGPCVWTFVEPKYCVNGPVGTDWCSKSDQFVRRVGHKLALQRAIGHMPVAVRRQIWAAYWSKV